MDSLGIFINLGVVYFLSAITPGPNFVLVVRNSLNFGRISGIVTSIGLGVGLLVHFALYFNGITYLILNSQILFLAIKTISSIYLIYLAFEIFKHRNDSLCVEINQNSMPQDNAGVARSFSSGFFTAALNPKILLFFVSVFAVMVPHDFSKTNLYLLTGLLLSIEVVWFSVVALLFTKENFMAYYEKFLYPINIFLSGVLCFLSLRIWFI